MLKSARYYFCSYKCETEAQKGKGAWLKSPRWPVEESECKSKLKWLYNPSFPSTFRASKCVRAGKRVRTGDSCTIFASYCCLSSSFHEKRVSDFQIIYVPKRQTKSGLNQNPWLPYSSFPPSKLNQLSYVFEDDFVTQCCRLSDGAVIPEGILGGELWVGFLDGEEGLRMCPP